MYYIDFDNTIYETGKLTKDILKIISDEVSVRKNEDAKKVFEDFKSSTDNFFTFAKKYCIEYKIDYDVLCSKILDIIINKGKEYVFPDAIKFLKKLKESNENVCILTYVSNSKNLEQQALKLAGSGILELVNEVYNTTNFKFELELDFKNSIFIDDSPRDIEGFYKKGARNIIRIIKPNNEKRTSKKLNLPEIIPELETFDEIFSKKVLSK